MKGIPRDMRFYVHQADVSLNQANPVSDTFYTILEESYVRIYGMMAYVTWAVTQPTPMTLRLTIDGNVIEFDKTDPVTDTHYHAFTDQTGSITNQLLSVNKTADRAFLMEGKSVKIEIGITWAITQPDPIIGKVTCARYI